MPDSLHLISLQISARSDEPCMAAFRETGRKQLSVDPYTGNLNGWTESPAFFGTVRKLHRWLLDPPPSKGEKSVGKAIVGVSTLALVLILVSGLILWIPRSRKALRNRLKVSCTYGRRRFWHDCHVSLGFYATLLLLVMALTGLTWSFGWYRTAAYALSARRSKPLSCRKIPRGKPIRAAVRAAKEAANGTPVGEHGGTQAETEARPFDYAVWDEVLGQLTAHCTVYKTIASHKAKLRSRGNPRCDASTARRSTPAAAVSPKSPVMKIRPGSNASAAGSMRSTQVRGAASGRKILYFLAALIGASLP